MRVHERIDEHSDIARFFIDPERSVSDNAGPYILVIDDFYPDPDRIRSLALSQRFVQYEPPQESQVPGYVFERFRGQPGSWYSTVLRVFHGRPVESPVSGMRYAPESLRLRMERVLSESIPRDEWATMGDGWNGAFHYLNGHREPGSIHHHYKDGDVTPRGWSGLVYLSGGETRGSGTSFWRARQTGICVAGMGANFDFDIDNFELVLDIESRYNRLVLFRENVLHRGGGGFGYDPAAARLFQTFFFVSSPQSP